MEELLTIVVLLLRAGLIFACLSVIIAVAYPRIRSQRYMDCSQIRLEGVGTILKIDRYKFIDVTIEAVSHGPFVMQKRGSRDCIVGTVSNKSAPLGWKGDYYRFPPTKFPDGTWEVLKGKDIFMAITEHGDTTKVTKTQSYTVKFLVCLYAGLAIVATTAVIVWSGEKLLDFIIRSFV